MLSFLQEELRRSMIGQQQGDSICAGAEYRQSPCVAVLQSLYGSVKLVLHIPFELMSIISLDT